MKESECVVFRASKFGVRRCRVVCRKWFCGRGTANDWTGTEHQLGLSASCLDFVNFNFEEVGGGGGAGRRKKELDLIS